MLALSSFGQTLLRLLAWAQSVSDFSNTRIASTVFPISDDEALTCSDLIEAYLKRPDGVLRFEAEPVLRGYFRSQSSGASWLPVFRASARCEAIRSLRKHPQPGCGRQARTCVRKSVRRLPRWRCLPGCWRTLVTRSSH